MTGGRRETSGAHVRWTEALLHEDPLCGWAVGLAHVPQSGLPDLIRPARTDTPSAPCASTPTDARTAGPAPAPLAPSTSPGERGGLPRRRVPGPSRAVCTLKTGRYRPARTASRHGPSEPRSSPARARGRLRRPASLPRVPRSRTGPSVFGLGASRGAPTGGVRPPPPPGLRLRAGAGGTYAVPRRTRRRAGAVRGTAGPAAWDRRRAGAPCACCAR